MFYDFLTYVFVNFHQNKRDQNCKKTSKLLYYIYTITHGRSRIFRWWIRLAIAIVFILSTSCTQQGFELWSSFIFNSNADDERLVLETRVFIKYVIAICNSQAKISKMLNNQSKQYIINAIVKTFFHFDAAMKNSCLFFYSTHHGIVQ